MPQNPKAEQKKTDPCDETGQLVESSYYYDDAHGYEDYDPDKEIDDEEDLED